MSDQQRRTKMHLLDWVYNNRDTPSVQKLFPSQLKCAKQRQECLEEAETIGMAKGELDSLWVEHGITHPEAIAAFKVRKRVDDE